MIQTFLNGIVSGSNISLRSGYDVALKSEFACLCSTKLCSGVFILFVFLLSWHRTAIVFWFTVPSFAFIAII